MGTSTARRAPTTRAWRQAKAAATRYLSPDSPAPVMARQVAARYVNALEEGPGQAAGGALAAFALARKVAQNLGEFCQQVKNQHWQATLERWGLAVPTSQPPEATAHALAIMWLPQAHGLAEDALRPALISLLTEILRAFSESPEGHTDSGPSEAVVRFLAAALYHRLVFDLGESLEAAAPGWRIFSEGLAKLKAELTKAAETGAGKAPAPSDWQGLEGWLWVTRLVEKMLNSFSARNVTQK
jgi:hypothetical protein